MSKIKAGTTSGTALVTEGDTTGQLVFQTNGTTTALTLGTDQSATFVGNVAVNGTLTASSGLPSLASPLTVTGNSTAGAEIRLPEDTDNGSNYIALKAPDSLASNVILTLPTSAGTNGQYLQTNGSGTLTFASVSAGPVVEYSRKFVTQSTTTFTVPTGVTSIKLYAGGRGGNGAASNGAGGGGGGFGFGTLAVTSGDVIDINIASGVATVSRSGTTLITANPGSNASGSTGGTGGTSSIHASLTSGAAYSGGNGYGSGVAGGGSAGSPLGNGYTGGYGYDTGANAQGGGGGGIGGAGGSGTTSSPFRGGGGGGAGGAGGSASGFSPGAGGGAGGASINGLAGVGRVIPFADPLLADLDSPGGGGGVGGATTSQSVSSGGPGGGGCGSLGGSYPGYGGFGGGGGGGSAGYNGGVGGALGGGGGGNPGGTSLACGGGGGGGSAGNGGVGGPATVWIFY